MKNSAKVSCGAVLLIASTILVSCGQSWSAADYIAIHKDGIQKLEASRQINAHYTDVDHFITYFGFGKQPLTWQTVAFIDGRFLLTLVVPVHVNYNNKTATPAGDPKFYIHAVESIRLLRDGQVEARFDSNLQREFGKAEWDRFVASGFDMTTLGIPKEQVHSVPLWKDYVHAWRKRQTPIK